MSFEEFLYADKSDKNMKTLKLNKNGDVIYMGKVVLNNNGVPLNDNTAYTDNELRILFHAMRIKPKKGCDVTDTLTNGAVGCYVEIPE